MYRAFEPSPIRRRTFFFVFKYYTVVSAEMAPAPWQQYDQRTPERREQDHIDIAECSSVLALSLEGPPMKKIQLQYRKKKPKQNGQVFNPSAPWHLLSIQSFPDNRHSIRSEDISKPFYNGPYAFLDSLAAEYRDAVKRLSKLNELIVKLTTPPVRKLIYLPTHLPIPYLLFIILSFPFSVLVGPSISTIVPSYTYTPLT